jgi:protein subunit release factor A
MERLLIEVRAAEGGDDAKLLVSEQVEVYVKLCTRHHL